ncbi:MAG: 4'-phosphopantetheinyl transferase superfamily protein [Ginsengibacter sp.]
MPLFYQHTINQVTELAVWKIAEPEDFFLEKVSVQKEITHPHKRLQHLAGRYLLQILNPGFPFELIAIAESRKPLLSNGKLHFSISHCADFAAAIISKDKSVGIDVELITPKIESIKNKFLSQMEIDLISKKSDEFKFMNYELLTLCWSTKESIFKWYGKKQVDFKKNMIIDNLFFENHHGMIESHFQKQHRTDLTVEFKFFEDLCLTWVL